MVSRVNLMAGLDHQIALAIVRRMAARGDRLALVGTEEGTPALSRDVVNMEMTRCSLSDRPAVESAIVRIEDRLGPLHHLIFGTSPPHRQAPLDATSRADWTDAIDAPLAAALRLCQAIMPRFAARKHGSVLFLLSDYAIIGLRDGAAFAAGQAALYSFAKSLAWFYPGVLCFTRARGALVEPALIESPGRTRALYPLNGAPARSGNKNLQPPSIFLAGELGFGRTLRDRARARAPPSRWASHGVAGQSPGCCARP
jgi:NAD(P)-dependent dehydrogenase (short-subunit alcohol dehydrogenase family)